MPEAEPSFLIFGRAVRPGRQPWAACPPLNTAYREELIMSRLSWFQTSHGAAKSLEINDPAMIYIREMLEHADRPYDCFHLTSKLQRSSTATGNNQVFFGGYSI